MEYPILTPALSNRIEKTDFDSMRERMLGIQNREGNPFGVQIEQFNEATALLAKGIQITDFNKVFGLSPENMGVVDDLIAYYTTHSMDFGVDVIPSEVNEDYLQLLAQKGFVQKGFHTAVYGLPHITRSMAAPGVEVREVGKQDVKLFADMFLAGNELPPDIAEGEESFAYLQATPSWKLYIAFFEGKPGGFAMMHIAEDGVACLAQVATVPELRGKGLQTAMLARRVHDAAKAGCHLITATAKYGSVSLRNLQKIGFQIAYTKAVYIKKV